MWETQPFLKKEPTWELPGTNFNQRRTRKIHFKKLIHKLFCFPYFRNMPPTRPNKRLATTKTRMTRKEREMQELEKMISQEEKSIKTPYKQTGITKPTVTKPKTKAPPKPSPKMKREKSTINKIYDYEDDFDDDFDDEKAAVSYNDDFDDESDENSETAAGNEGPSRSDSKSENFDVVSKRSSSNMSETIEGK